MHELRRKRAPTARSLPFLLIFPFYAMLRPLAPAAARSRVKGVSFLTLSGKRLVVKTLNV